MSWLINRALSWEVYVPRHPSHVASISSNASLCFEICVMQRLQGRRLPSRTLTQGISHVGYATDSQNLWQILLVACDGRWFIRFATSSTSFCRSSNRHAPIFYSSIFSSKTRLLLYARRRKQNIVRRGTKLLCSIASGSRHYSHPRLSVASVERGDFNPLHHAYCTCAVSIKNIGI